MEKRVDKVPWEKGFASSFLPLIPSDSEKLLFILLSKNVGPFLLPNLQTGFLICVGKRLNTNMKTTLALLEDSLRNLACPAAWPLIEQPRCQFCQSLGNGVKNEN